MGLFNIIPIAGGVITNWTLNAEKVVRLAPPLNITIDEVDFALDAMRRALETVRAGGLS